jgi:hypothetical protein
MQKCGSVGRKGGQSEGPWGGGGPCPHCYEPRGHPWFSGPRREQCTLLFCRSDALFAYLHCPFLIEIIFSLHFIYHNCTFRWLVTSDSDTNVQKHKRTELRSVSGYSWLFSRHSILGRLEGLSGPQRIELYFLHSKYQVRKISQNKLKYYKFFNRVSIKILSN